MDGSYIVFMIDNPKLVEICKKHQLKLKISKKNIIKDKFYLGGYELDRPSRPKGENFVDWFISFTKEIGLITDEAEKEIEESRKSIEDSHISSEIFYQFIDTKDIYDNCYYEEKRTGDFIEIKGIDAFSWMRIWEEEKHEEIARKVNVADVDRYCPENYPFYQILLDENPFLDKMLNVYGSLSFKSDELTTRFREMEYIDFYRTNEFKPDEVDFRGKTVCIRPLEWLKSDDPRRTAFGYDGLAFDVAKKIIEYSGGKVTKSLSYKTDYAVISTEQAYFESPNCSELDMYKQHLVSLKRSKEEYVIKNEKRKSKNLDDIKTVFLEDFLKWVSEKYNELKKKNIFFAFGKIEFNVTAVSINKGVLIEKFKSRAFASINPEMLLTIISECKTIREVVDGIEKATAKGAFSLSNPKGLEYLLEKDKHFSFDTCAGFVVIFESSSGNKFSLTWNQNEKNYSLRDSEWDYDAVVPEQKESKQICLETEKEKTNAPATDDETILSEYTELLTSRIGTYPKKNISFEDLKFFNPDISFSALNRITIKLHGEKAIRYCTRMGFMKNKEEE